MEFHLHKHGTSYPGMIRAMYEIPALIIAASRTGGFEKLPLVPNQVDICEEIQKLLTAGSEKNDQLVKMARGARQVQVKVSAKDGITQDLSDLQLHLNFIAVGRRNEPFFRIEILVPKKGQSRLLKIWPS